MARPPNADGQRTRQAILDAALDLFADKGYFGTSLRDVARVVGVRESALYNYFPGKEALFEALLTAESSAKAAPLAALLDRPITDARDVLERLALFALDQFVQPRQQQLFRIVMSDGVRLARDGRINLIDRMGSNWPRLVGFMRHLVGEGHLRDVDPEMLVMQFAGPLLLWRQFHAIGDPRAIVRNRRAFARGHVDQFLAGAAAAPRPVGARVRRTRAA